MAFRTICSSGTDGSDMRLVAAEVAERLGLRVVDEEIVMRAAAESGGGTEIVADVERRRTFLDRALGAYVASEPAAFPGGMAYAGDGRLDETGAEKAVNRADAARADHLRRLYGERHESPEQYDLMLSTGRPSASGVAAIVGHAAGG